MRLLLRLLKEIPILGDLADTTLEDHIYSLKELIVTLFMSTLPIWGGAFIIILTSKTSDGLNYFNSIELLVSNGELYLYATSLLAPVIYIALKEREEGKKFPSNITHMLIVILIAVLSTIAFTTVKAGTNINHHFLIRSSVVAYITSVLLLYLAMVFNNNLLPDPIGRMKRDERDYTEAVKARRKQQSRDER